MTPSIEKALAWKATADKHLKDVVRFAQKRCKHLDLAECDYRPGTYGSLASIRICLRCGMTESGWSWYVLRGEARHISREELYSKRLGLMIEEQHKGPLLRGEITLAELIDLEGELPEYLRETNDL